MIMAIARQRLGREAGDLPGVRVQLASAVPITDYRFHGRLEEQLAQASPDLLRAMVSRIAENLMGA
jgi:hypothetical protein